MIRLASLAAVVAALLTAGPQRLRSARASRPAPGHRFRRNLRRLRSPARMTGNHTFTTFGKMFAHMREHGG